MFIATATITTPIADGTDPLRSIDAAELLLVAAVDDGAGLLPAAEVAAIDAEGTVTKPEELLDATGATEVVSCCVEEEVVRAAEEAEEELLDVDVVTTIDFVEVGGGRVASDVVWGGGGGEDIEVVAGGGGVVVVCCCDCELLSPPDWATPAGQVLAPDENEPFFAK
jgi:hypothetical protein